MPTLIDLDHLVSSNMLAAATTNAEAAASSFLGGIKHALSAIGLGGEIHSEGRLLLGVLLLVLLVLLYLVVRLTASLRRQRSTIRALRSKIHGRHIKRGYVSEALAPLLEQFPVDVGKSGTTTLFVGQPVDYLHFDDAEGITLIEIKSGGATLSGRQRRLREHVERGNVRWETMKVDSDSGPKSHQRNESGPTSL